MTEKYKILGQYIKDLSSETPNIETYLFVKDQITKYHLNIDITSKPLKNTAEINDNNIQYYKKIIKPSEEEINLHKNFLKNSLKKNYFN